MYRWGIQRCDKRINWSRLVTLPNALFYVIASSYCTVQFNTGNVGIFHNDESTEKDRGENEKIDSIIEEKIADY